MNKRSSVGYQHVPDDDAGHERRTSVIDMSLQRLAICTAVLPLGGFLFCVLWSLLIQFSKTTATHCNVANLLPSLSAATGSFMPQKAVWKVSIALHTGTPASPMHSATDARNGVSSPCLPCALQCRAS